MKSIVLLDVLFCLAQMTMRWHHVTGSPIGTGSRTPQSHISVQAGFDGILPVEGYWYG